MNTSLHSRPTGWFQIGWSHTVPPRGVIPLHYFGQDLVAWRDTSGTVHVLDAHCQHLGANLAYGGCVTDDGLQCPFHGWTWDGDGRNVAIPYQDRPNKARRVRPWCVREQDDVLYLWHDLRGRPPSFEVPEIRAGVSPDIAGVPFRSALRDEGYQIFSRTHIHPQLVAENAVDPHHFRFVHKVDASPVVLLQDVTDTAWHTVIGFGRRWADGIDRPGDRRSTLTVHFAGLGLGFNAEHTHDGWRIMLIGTTPVDDETFDLFGTYWLEDVDGQTAEDHARRIEQIKRALPEDMMIWEHQRYLDRPGLATSEAAGFTHLRRWASAFYPSTAPAELPSWAS